MDLYDAFMDFSLPTLPADPVEARAELMTWFKDYNLPIPFADMSADALAASPAHLLVSWRFDYENNVRFYAVPVDAISPALRDAFVLVNNRAFAYQEMFAGDDESKAFVRIEVATDADEADELLQAFEQYFPGFSDTIADTDRACLEPFLIAQFEDGDEPTFVDGGFDKRFVAASFTHRCM